MKPLRLLFGTHNHQPDGTSPRVFESAYQRSYKPFLSLLYKFPRVHTVLHYCGCLFEWMEDRHPEFITLIKEMIRRKQVELLGGGYHAPILPLIPDGDKLGQIEKMNTYIRTTFGTRPRGSWISERVWEPALARILANSGIEYTFLDDHHFHVAGIPDSECYHPYRTEDQGKAVTVLPIHLGLRSMVPAGSVEDLILELRNLAEREREREQIAVIMVRGEMLGDGHRGADAFGEGGWLSRFFRFLEENRGWLQSTNPRYHPEVIRPGGRVYLPCLSSMESMNGALPMQRQKAFQELSKKARKPDNGVYLQRGFFRQYLTRYPEIGLLYSRLMYTHLLVNQIRGDKYKKKAALNEMWRGQTGSVYWHSRRGGAYSNPLRKAAYMAFSEAEKITRNASMFMPSIIATDYDQDGREEYLYQGRVVNAFVHSRGATVVELDYLPRCWNYLDTMARWPESYHRYKYEGCDWYMRKGFIDHFFAPSTTMEKFERMTYQESGDFIGAHFQLKELKRESRRLVLSREGQVRVKRTHSPVGLLKRYQFRENGIELEICIRNGASQPVDLWYGTELNLSLADVEEAVFLLQGSGSARQIDAEPSEARSLRSVQIHDKSNRVQITLAGDREFDLWSLPVCTKSYLEDTVQRIYQGSCLLPHWHLSLNPQEQQRITVSVDLRKR